MMTETTGPRDAAWAKRMAPPAADAPPSPCRSTRTPPLCRCFQVVDTERQASFFMTGGLVAVHAEGRDRDSIWYGAEAA